MFCPFLLTFLYALAERSPFARCGVCLMLPFGKTPNKETWRNHSEEEVFGSEKISSVNKEGIDEHLNAIAQCGAGGEEEDEPCLPYLQLASLLHCLAAYVEACDEHEHREGEMVGHHKGEHHVAEGISEEGYQQ